MVSIKFTSPLSRCEYNEQFACYQCLCSLSVDYNVEIELGSKIVLSADGYEEVHEYREQDPIMIVNDIRSWCEGFEDRLQRYIDGLPGDDECEDITISELLGWAPYLGIEEDELIACAEDMEIEW